MSNIPLRSKSYTIPVPPIIWQRAGLNGTRFYDAQKSDKIATGLYLNQQHGNEPLFDKAIHMEVIFYMPIPKSIPKREKSVWHTAPGDLDNLCKFLLDASKNITMSDDRILSSLIAKKIYDKNPRTEFTITELGRDDKED